MPSEFLLLVKLLFIALLGLPGDRTYRRGMRRRGMYFPPQWTRSWGNIAAETRPKTTTIFVNFFLSENRLW